MLKLKQKSFAIFVLMGCASSHSFASADVMMPLDDFSSKLYNSLPEVEVANANIQSKGAIFDEFLGKVSTLAKTSEFNELIGLRLIHRHHSINDNEAMAESYEIFDQEEALVTRPVKVDDLSEYVPSSWIYSGGKMQVFEYSKDQRVKNGYRYLQENEFFVSSFLNLLQKYQMQTLVSFAILDREWYQRLSGEIYFNEESYDDGNSSFSVVRPKEMSLEGFSKGYIKTAWIMNSPVNYKMGCRNQGDRHVRTSIAPYTYGCTGTFICRDDGFGHRSTRAHRR